MHNFILLATGTTPGTTIRETLSATGDSIIDSGIETADEVINGVTENVTSWWQELDLFNKFIDNLPSLIVAVLTLVIGVVCAKLAGKLVIKALKAKNVDPSVHGFVRSIVVMLIYIVFILSALSKFGFNINSFVAAIGAAGVTAGLGLQQSVSQFASGIQILINHPFKKGDYIEVGSNEGSVSDIHLMYTVITTIDNKRVIIPNSHLTSNSLTNYSAENKRRVDLKFNISYSTDISKAKNIILDIAKQHPLILDEPTSVVFVNSHEASSICLIAKLWCETGNYWDVYYDLEEKVKLAFDREGVNIPFDQLEVTIVNK